MYGDLYIPACVCWYTRTYSISRWTVKQQRKGEQTPTLCDFKRIKPPDPPLQSSVTLWASAMIPPPGITETNSSNIPKFSTRNNVSFVDVIYVSWRKINHSQVVLNGTYLSRVSAGWQSFCCRKHWPNTVSSTVCWRPRETMARPLPCLGSTGTAYQMLVWRPFTEQRLPRFSVGFSNAMHCTASYILAATRFYISKNCG